MTIFPTIPPEYRTAEIAHRIGLVASSFERMLGRPLVPSSPDVALAMWRAPAVIVAHGTEADPVFFFGNEKALQVFECDVAGFTRMPSRLSAEAPLRDERQALLDRVSTHGFIDDYSGIRISSTGRRFRIERAIVWNLIDGDGRCHGQAATFEL